MNPKRILIAVESHDFNLLNRYSAVACVIYSFSDLLRKNGFEIWVNNIKIEEWEAQQESETTVLIPVKSFYRFFSKRIRELIKDVIKFHKLSKLKTSVGFNPKPDIIISWISYGSSFCVDLSKKWNVPLISIFDNPINEEYKYLFGFSPFFKRKIERDQKRILVNSRAIIAYSNEVSKYIESKYNTTAKFYYKAFTDFKRMTFNEFERSTSEINLAYIGSFFNWHKIDDLIEAFLLLEIEKFNCKLFLIGNGPEYERLMNSVSQERIIFTGRKDGSELEKLLKIIHIGVIPNALWFQGPVKLFQYSAAQMPVICKSTPTIKELTEKREGYLFFDSIEELTKQMIFLIQNRDLITKAGKSNQEFVQEKFSQKAYLNLFEKIFQDLNQNNT